MIHLALTAISGLVLILGSLAQDTKPAVSPLEGEWREPGLPGEDASVRHRITIKGKTVTVCINDQVLRGTITHGVLDEGETRPKEEPPPSVTINITEVKGEGTFAKGRYTGSYLSDEKRMYLTYSPDKPERKGLYSPVRPMRLAPITIKLEKVKK